MNLNDGEIQLSRIVERYIKTKKLIKALGLQTNKEMAPYWCRMTRRRTLERALTEMSQKLAKDSRNIKNELKIEDGFVCCWPYHVGCKKVSSLENSHIGKKRSSIICEILDTYDPHFPDFHILLHEVIAKHQTVACIPICKKCNKLSENYPV